MGSARSSSAGECALHRRGSSYCTVAVERARRASLRAALPVPILGFGEQPWNPHRRVPEAARRVRPAGMPLREDVGRDRGNPNLMSASRARAQTGSCAGGQRRRLTRALRHRLSYGFGSASLVRPRASSAGSSLPYRSGGSARPRRQRARAARRRSVSGADVNAAAGVANTSSRVDHVRLRSPGRRTALFDPRARPPARCRRSEEARPLLCVRACAGSSLR
jgi:hypothetical protein